MSGQLGMWPTEGSAAVTQEIWLIRDRYPIHDAIDRPMQELTDAESIAKSSRWVLGPSYPLAWDTANQSKRQDALEPSVAQHLEEMMASQAEIGLNHSREELRAFKEDNDFRRRSRERQEIQARREGSIRLMKQALALLFMALFLLTTSLELTNSQITLETLPREAGAYVYELIEGADGATAASWVSPRHLEAILAAKLARLAEPAPPCDSARAAKQACREDAPQRSGVAH